ncbi:MAG: thioesterase family protein [Dongiaceae bacterium]
MSSDKRSKPSNSNTPLFVDTSQSVLSEWMDYNKHMNIIHYQRVFERAMGHVCAELSIGSEMMVATGVSLFTGEQHIVFKRELFAGDQLRIETQLIDLDERKSHWFQTMFNERKNYVASTCEHLILFVDTKVRRVTKAPAEVLQKLERILELHRKLPMPDDVGRRINLDPVS